MTAQITQAISALPTAPARSQTGDTFNANAQNTVAALPTLRSELNTFATQANALANGVNADATAAAGSAGAAAQSVIDAGNAGAAQVALAATQAGYAGASAAAAAASAGASLWISGHVYTAGQNAISPSDWQTYRRTTNGSGIVDPKLDAANWVVVASALTGEIGTISFLSSLTTANSVTMPNGGVYLKAGTVAKRADAVAANYDVSTLEALGMCCPYPVSNGPAGSPIAFGAGVFVTVGSAGAIKYSADGVTWNTATSGTASDLQDVRFLNGQFVAVGTTWLGTSPDGITWTAKTTPFSGTAKMHIAYLGGVYVASSSSTGGAYYSADLTTWAAVVTFNPYLSPAYGAGVFVYPCETPANGLVTLDGSGSPKLTHNVAQYFDVVYAGGKFVAASCSAAVGAVSTDGLTWTPTTTVAATRPNMAVKRSQVAYGAGVYVAPRASGAQSSADGSTWTSRTSGAGLYAVQFLNTLFLQYGGDAAYGAANLYTSPDGINWTGRTAGGMYVFGAAYGAGVYVVAGCDAAQSNNAIYSSPDGATWTSRSGAGTRYLDVAFGNSLFVAVGKNGQISTSPDGTTWTTRTSGVAQDLYRVQYLNGYWIAVGSSGTIIYSVDGITWSSAAINKQNTGTTSCYDVQYQGGKWLVFGSAANGYGYATSIGTWTWVTSSTLAIANAKLTSGGGKMLAYLAGSTSVDSLQCSGDGKVWAGLARPSTLTNSATLTDFVCANGKVVGTSGQYVVYSADYGVTWSSADLSSITSTFYGVGWNGANWWVAGNSTRSATSPDLATWTARYGAAATGPSRIEYGAGTFVGAVGASAHVTPDGVTGAVGCPMSVTLTNTTAYVKVK